MNAVNLGEINEPQGSPVIFQSIRDFVLTSDLFKYVEDKEGAISELQSVVSEKGFERELDTLCNILQNSPRVCSELNYLNNNLLHLTVIAFMQGRIQDYQLATVFYRASVFKRYNSEEAMAILNPQTQGLSEVHLFAPYGDINPLAWDLIKQTMWIRGKPSYEFIDDATLLQWFENMRSLPESEQVFIIGDIYTHGFANTQARIAKKEKKTPFEIYAGRYLEPKLEQSDILDVANLGPGFNIFNRVHYQGRAFRIFASVGMCEKLIEVAGGEKVHVFRFGAGDSAWDGENRVVSFASPYAILPSYADHYLADFELFTSHDLLYHLFKVSFIPKPIRTFFMVYSQVLKQTPAYRENPEAIGSLMDRISDLDIHFYDKGARESLKKFGLDANLDSLQFWFSFNEMNLSLRKRIFRGAMRALVQSNPDRERNEMEREGLEILRQLQDPKHGLDRLEAHKSAIRTLFVEKAALAREANIDLQTLILMVEGLKKRMAPNWFSNNVHPHVCELALYAKELIQNKGSSL